uniref:CathepsinC_exc domain-containing protein n=1 Tax=Steinernema glaseri TaxID=37863 RepID=A0A1I8AV94_9BILA
MRLAASVLLLCLLAASHRLAKGAKLVHVQAKGMWQHYQQGLKLKEEYIDSRKFINANYTSSEVCGLKAKTL